VDGILFGLFHLLNLLGPSIFYFGGYPGWTLDIYKGFIISTSFQVVYASSLGIAWAFLFVKSGSLWPCILGHWFIDAFGGLVLYPNIYFTWIYFPIITVLGLGVLPAVLNWYIIKTFYKGDPRNPWNNKEDFAPI
jgi:membrane protease YdiL (CAAX protease family)